MRGLGVGEASCRGETMHRFQPNEAGAVSDTPRLRPRADVQPVESYTFGLNVFLIRINPPRRCSGMRYEGAMETCGCTAELSDKGVT